MNKQKDRLVELLKETRCERSCDGFKNIEVCNGCTAYERYAESADRILADGWMRPPCKVGQTVYVLRSQTSNGKNLYLREERIDHYRVFDTRVFMLFDSGRMSVPDYLWETRVFLTREEAEAKLKEGVQG